MNSPLSKDEFDNCAWYARFMAAQPDWDLGYICTNDRKCNECISWHSSKEVERRVKYLMKDKRLDYGVYYPVNTDKDGVYVICQALGDGRSGPEFEITRAD
jgi:hypothetical protein